MRLSLAHRFAVPVGFALVSLPVFVFFGWYLVRAEQVGATQTLVRATEVQNAGLARTLANAHSEPILHLFAFNTEDAPELLPAALNRSGLRERVTDSLHDTNIVNVKIYDSTGITLFSLNDGDLGVDISSCECFATVLGGTPVSELVFADQHDHSHSGFDSGHPHVSGDADLLTTMIRINVLTPDLVASDGVLEVQSDVTSLVGAIAATRQEVSVVVGVPLAILYVALLAIVTLGHFMILRRDRRAVQFAARAAESDASSKAKSEFLSLMSHELRTPLNAIIGFSQLIGDGREDDETTAYANTIHDSGQHMLRLVTSILDMTALETGALNLEREVVRLEDVLRASLINVQPAFESGLVTLTMQSEVDQDPVLGDREKLKQVFENLLSNAARFTPAGGKVSVRFTTDPDGFACVSITDTGVGMTKEQIDRARMPFQQSWVGYARNGDGAGLGLTIADKVVQHLGGDLTIESVTDVGTKIVVRLPACNGDRENVTAFDPTPDSASDQPTRPPFVAAE